MIVVICNPLNINRICRCEKETKKKIISKACIAFKLNNLISCRGLVFYFVNSILIKGFEDLFFIKIFPSSVY